MTRDPLLDDEGAGGLGGGEEETRAHPPYKERSKNGRPALQKRRAPHPQEQQSDHPPGPELGRYQVGRDAEDKVGYENGRPKHSLGKGRQVHLIGDVRQQDADDENDAERRAYAGSQGANYGPASQSGAFKGGLQSNSREWAGFRGVRAILYRSWGGVKDGGPSHSHAHISRASA